MPNMADGPASQATASESSASRLSDTACRMPLVPVPDGEEPPDELPEGSIECSICLQGCIHPVQLPCSHIFCFLCVKGVANHSKRCALCRSEIPPEFLFRPMLVNADDVLQTRAFDGKYQWFYEGVRGWWQYDVRASTEIEDRFQRGERVFEMLIAGFLYVVDMENMVQYRRNTPSRRRRVKRDLVDIPDKKGVAGLSCRLRPPKRTGGDGGERANASVAAPVVAGPSGAGPASAAGAPVDGPGATDGKQMSGVQLQMENLTLVDADGGVNRNPRASRNVRAPGVERAAVSMRGGSRAADVSTGRQPNPGSRSNNRVNRQPIETSADGRQNQDARVNRVGAQSVDVLANGQPNQDTRFSRSEMDGVDGAVSSQQSSVSSQINQVNAQGVDASGNYQRNRDSGVNSVNSDDVDTTASSRGNQVVSRGVDMMATRQTTRGNNRVDALRVETTTDNQLSVDNHAVARQTVVNADESAALRRVGEIDEARLADQQQGASTDQRRIEGEALADRTSHVDGSSDSE